MYICISKIFELMKLIERKQYTDKLNSFKDKKVIKIITGVRRCGKSTLMQLFQHNLLNSGVEKNCITAINFENYDFFELRQSKELYNYVSKRLVSDKMNYIFLDEIQHVDNYADVVDALFVKENTDIYITGSNAYLLSSEIATLLSGRFIEIHVLPLSFKEYISALEKVIDIDRHYSDYITFSSFPYAIEFDREESLINDYLRGIYSTIVLKDVVQRNRINDALTLENLMTFVSDNIGNTLSIKKITDTISSSGKKVDFKTIEKYVSALCQSFILYPVKRYNIKGRELLKTMEKYYLVDVALRNTLLGNKKTDFGHILENVVFLELIRRNHNVYIGKTDSLEVDFVAVKMQEVTYYQVAATVLDYATLEREIRALKNINDNFPKILLTLDKTPTTYHDGIKQQNVLDWLLEC